MIYPRPLLARSNAGGGRVSVRRPTGAFLRHVPERVRLLQPFLEVFLRHRLDLDRHEGMVETANLIALPVVSPGLLDLHPGLVLAADNGVFLDTHRRHEPAV